MYIELHAHSFYSLLDGVASPEALVQQAARYDLPAIALTDHDALYGAVRFAQAAAQVGVKPIFGCEITLVNGGHLTLLAEDDAGYRNLCRIVTLARRDQHKGAAALPWQAFAEHAKGLIALSGCRRGEIARALLQLDTTKASRIAERYAAIFGKENFFLEIQRHYEHGDNRLAQGLNYLAERLRLRLVATGNSHYPDRAQAPVHDILTCIRHRVPLEKAGSLLRSNDEYYFRSPTEMAALFVDWPDALRATQDIAERCHARLAVGPQRFPLPQLPAGWAPEAYLRHLCEIALAEKCVGRDLREYRATLDREMSIIVAQDLLAYFLIVWDAVGFARSRGILCQGRGSAANSLVAYLLGITPIDPLSAGLVFERFLSPERTSPADIDVDFAANRREEIIQYLFQKYGHEFVAMSCTVVTFGARQAIRDAGMTLGFPAELLERINQQVDSPDATDLPNSSRLRATFGSQVDTPRWQQLLSLASALDSHPRHLGIHVGGMVISEPPLVEQIPIEPAAMDDRYVVQWDKDSLEAAGWVKIDVLSLRAMAAIEDACALIAHQTGNRPDLPALRFDDPKVYDMICRGEAIGVFQIESRAQASLIPKFQPRNFADLTIQIALIRPGPVQANMVHPYLRRRARVEAVQYLHPRLRPALEETHGVILFQEQVLVAARDLAGFTAGEGEQLRRALGHKRAETQIASFREKFLAGALANGVSLSVANKVFEQLRAFGGYSFSKAHAAAFAVLAYWSAWLRCYHPLAFFVGLLRNQPMGFYPPHVIVSEAKRAGVKILPVDLRYSAGEVSAEGNAVRLGLSYIDGFGPTQVEAVETERLRRPFASLADLVKRTGLDRRRVEALVLAGALDYLGERRQVLWDIAEAYRLAKRPEELPFDDLDEQVNLKPMDDRTRLATTFAYTRVSIEAHLTILRRDAFTRAGARPIRELRKQRAGEATKVGGLVIACQRPATAKGVCYLALEDTDGLVNVVVPVEVYEACRDAVRAFVIVEGVVQWEGGKKSVYVVARKITEV